MRNEHERALVLPERLLQDFPGFYVEVDGGLVHEDEPHGPEHHPGERETVFFAAAQNADFLAHVIIRGKQEHPEYVPYCLDGFVAGNAGHFLQHGQILAQRVDLVLGVVVNRDIGAAAHATGRGLDFSGHDFQQRGLAAAVRSD